MFTLVYMTLYYNYLDCTDGKQSMNNASDPPSHQDINNDLHVIDVVNTVGKLLIHD